MGKIDWNADLDDGVKVLFDPEEDARRLRESADKIIKNKWAESEKALLGGAGFGISPSAAIGAAVGLAPVEKMDWEIVKALMPPTAPSKRQIGGDHYKNFVIQPGEFIYRNQLGWHEGNAVKYICRHKSKGGRVDIEKAIHYLELLLELEYGTK